MSDHKLPIGLIILDGFGYSTIQHGNAIATAPMPTWSYLTTHYPWFLLNAAEQAVGLQPGQQGNSEVGHLTIGAGRVIPSTITRINTLVANNNFHNHPVVQETCSYLHNNKNQALHLIGLLSDGQIHSSLLLLEQWILTAHHYGIRNIYIHAITDGRDTAPKSAHNYFSWLTPLLQKTGASIATIHGRFYAMDRDLNWDRTEISYQTLIGQSETLYNSWQETLDHAYNHSLSDEFIMPSIIDTAGIIKPFDCVAVFNTRPDRIKQLMTYITGENQTIQTIPIARCITPIAFESDHPSSTTKTLIPILSVDNTLVDTLINNNINCFIAAESEKKAHVTYFLQGQRDNSNIAITLAISKSHKAMQYKNDPAMSADDITHNVIQKLQKNDNTFFIINYANADMVGHSGDFVATQQACSYIDKQLKTLYKSFVQERNGTLFITADHGNAEYKIDALGNPHTAHTKNPVPFCIVSQSHLSTQDINKTHATRGLAAVAPTILHYMQIPIPPCMEKPLL